MVKILLVACLLFTATAVKAQPNPELVQRSALDGLVTLLIPESFSLMDSEMLRLKYPSGQRPTEVYTNQRASINVALSHTTSPLAPEQVAGALATMEQTFKRAYPKARWNRSEVVTKDGRSYIMVDLWTPAIDTDVRNIMLGTSAEGRLLLVSFNVTRELEPTWGAVGQQIIESVRVNP